MTAAEMPETAAGRRGSPAEFDLLEHFDPLSEEEPLSSAYRRIAALMGDGTWHSWHEIHDHMAAERPGVPEKELRHFFNRIARQGWVTQGNFAGVPRFRVTRCGLIERPELRGREGQGAVPAVWLELQSQADWLDAPRAAAPDPAPEQPRSEAKKAKPKPTTPKVAQIVASDGDLHPSEHCKCGQRLTFRSGKQPPKGDRWVCPFYRGRPGVPDVNHDLRWWAS